MSTSTPDFAGEYEGPTAAEAASVFADAGLTAADPNDAQPSGFDVRALDPRNLDLSTLREFDWRTLDPRELAGKVDIASLDPRKLELPKFDLGKVTQEATSLVSTATTKATETASDLRRSVESGVKIVRELVGR